MEFTKIFHGIHREIPMSSHRFSMEFDTYFPWNSTFIFHGIRHLFSMEFDTYFHGICLEKRGMRLPFSCAGVENNVPVSYPRPPRGPDKVAARLERLDPCGYERSFLASTGHPPRAEYQPATVRMAPA